MSVSAPEDRVCVRVAYRRGIGVTPEHDLWPEVSQGLREMGRVLRHGGLRRWLRDDDTLDPRYALAVFEADTWDVGDAESEFGLSDEVRRYLVRVEVVQTHHVTVDAISADEAHSLAWQMVAEGGSDPEREHVEVRDVKECKPQVEPQAVAS